MGGLCEGRAIRRQSIWCAGLSCLFHSLNEMDQTNQTNEMNQIHAMRREMLECRT